MIYFLIWIYFSQSLHLLISLSVYLFLSVLCLYCYRRSPTFLQLSHITRISVRCISVIFNVDPDTHIDSIEQAELAVLEGTANWSAKIAVTGTLKIDLPCSNATKKNGFSVEHQTCRLYIRLNLFILFLFFSNLTSNDF